MNRLSSLPRDIYLSSLLPYIPPQNLDSYCSSSLELESWCNDPKNIRYYLASRNLSFKTPNDGWIWAIDTNSRILTNYFQRLIDEETRRHVNMIEHIISLGPNEINEALMAALNLSHSDIIRHINNFM